MAGQPNDANCIQIYETESVCNKTYLCNLTSETLQMYHSSFRNGFQDRNLFFRDKDAGPCWAIFTVAEKMNVLTSIWR